jgi:hypothetical protein
MYSFLSEYFSTVVLAPHAIRYHAAQVASGIKCGLHGGKNSKMKSWTVSWLNLKTKVELRLHGSRVMSGDWRRLHQVRGVCGGSPENHQRGFQAKTGLTGLENQSDWFGVAGHRKLQSGGHASGSQSLRQGYAKCGRRSSV